MAAELAYAVITPYTIRKSRTGAVLARMLGRISAKLVCTQMFACTEEMAERFAQTIRKSDNPEDERCRAWMRDYIRTNFVPSPNGRRHRCMMLVFYGENARRELFEVVGHLVISSESGETVRDAFGDLVFNPDGSMHYFEPAVITGDPEVPVGGDLRTWADFAATQSPVLEQICEYPQPELVQQTLVVIKPDSWRQKSARPGTIVGMFSRTGLRMIACKRLEMTIDQALQFYGPVRNVLRRKLSPGVAAEARKRLEEWLGFSLPEESTELLVQAVGMPFAEEQFTRIIEFMVGTRPDGKDSTETQRYGNVGVLALIYEGVDAVNKIRNVLGPTDPSKAPEGTVRREFGSDVMVNTAHASDSPESAEREMRILRMHESAFAETVHSLLELQETELQ